MARDPYAQVSKPIRKSVPAAGFTPPSGNFTFPAKPREPENTAFSMDPAQLDAMLSQGYTIYEDGSVAPPAPMMPDAVDPSLPPPPDMWDNPIFAAHMNVRNPVAPEPDPMKQMQRQQAKALGMKEPKAGPNVAVPGGASIQNGMPMAASTPAGQYEQADDPLKKGDPYGGRFGRRQETATPPRRRR